MSQEPLFRAKMYLFTAVTDGIEPHNSVLWQRYYWIHTIEQWLVSKILSKRIG